MKQIFFSFLMVLIAFQQTYAQIPSDKIVSFRNDVLSQYSTYFIKAELSENGQLVLSANEKYNSLPLNSRKVIMDNLMKKWQESLVLVQYETKSELWGLNSDNGKALRIDTWDLNATNTTGPSLATASRTGLHPFFVYFGGQGVLDSERNLNFAINTRVGFFLLKDRWDLAWTFSGGILGNIDNTDAMSNQLSTGLMSKVYFPIRKLNISPNAGFDLQSTAYSDAEGSTTTSANRALLMGISWYVGHGSLDFGVRIGKEVTATIGYTIMPRFDKKKKK
jgi:hypothetical protein